MTEAQINQELNSEYEAFLYGKYEGKIAIPKNVIEIFKIAVLALPSYAHKIAFTKIKAISTTPVNKLTYSDLNEIIKVVFNVPLEKLYPDLSFEEIVEKGILMDKFVLSYNNQIEEFQKQLSGKKERLQKLAGGVLNYNGMKVIPQA